MEKSGLEMCPELKYAHNQTSLNVSNCLNYSSVYRQTDKFSTKNGKYKQLQKTECCIPDNTYNTTKIHLTLPQSTKKFLKSPAPF